VRGEFVKRLCEGLETSHIARRRPNPVKSAIRSADGVGVQRSIATHKILPIEYVDAVLSYYVETKGWDTQYVAQLRQEYLHG
ncbi:hypothetical protein PM023_17310, partial [Halorubrum ezzemoulense]|nr:hypothetical protein [Halorubrum ezzemoulense]